MRSAEPTVAAVILNWNGGDEIMHCLQSVVQSSYPSVEIVIVDNGSTDGSTEAILHQFPQVYLIRNSENLGFARGSNQGMEWALQHGIPYVLLLNGDARLHPEAIGELLTAVQGELDTVVACPRMYIGASADGNARLWFAYGTVKLWAGLFQNPAFNQIDGDKWSSPREMEFASGCCMLIPAKILESVGMLDESFFAYCEDVDFSLRVRKAGFRLRYTPTARLWHGSKTPTNRTRTPIYRYLATRNNLWVVRKHGSALYVLICLCVLPIRSFFRIAKMMLDARWNAIAAEIRGISDGVFGRVTRTQCGRDLAGGNRFASECSPCILSNESKPDHVRTGRGSFQQP